MKKNYILFLLCILFVLAGRAQQYPQVLLSGDYPDPSIMRDGEDYYMTHSPFYYAPGLLIWHSRDLKNWEPVTRVLPEYTGSAMAPDLLKYKNKFYIYYPAQGTNWVIWANAITGPWSKPIDLKVSGIDPGHVVGEDGKRYLYVDKGFVIGLADDGLSTVGEQKNTYNGWKYPDKWKTECMCLESPKLIFKNGYFYITSAEGGTAGPATSHMAVSARSKSVFGPWENSPYNPIVHTYSSIDNWWSKGHGTLIDDVNGNWWIIYHGYRNNFHTLGRSTLIEPVEWTKDGWFRPNKGATPIKPLQEHVVAGLKLSDDFTTGKMGLQWTFWKEYSPESVKINRQSLHLTAKGTGPADGRLLLTTATDQHYETQVEVNSGKGNRAGLLLYYNEKAYAGIVSDGKRFSVYKNAEKMVDVPNKFGNHFFLKIRNRANNCQMLASKDGLKWIMLVDQVDVSGLNHNNFNGFYALRVGLLSAGTGDAVFKHFKYENAVPQEKDMSAYLMVYFKDETHGLHMALSPDGYSFTDINSGKPVIAGDTIAEQKGIRDPYIYRGPDGAFYLAMTDLHLFAQKEGYRQTEWQRGKEYGWGNNRALVLMKSWDLINWSHNIVRIDTLSAGFKDIGCAWAPEITFDQEKGKLMIYFTMRYKNEANKLYYVYVNDNFDQVETLPVQLFHYPDENISTIDADITKVGDIYHMFYVSHDGTPGIKHAYSTKINSDYKYDARWYDPEPKACEAPTVWKRIGEEKWVLTYDIYGISPHNFGFSETTDFVNFKDLGHFNEGVMKATNFNTPKHPAIIQLTKAEAENLATKWKANISFK